MCEEEKSEGLLEGIRFRLEERGRLYPRKEIL
jgi:hypothetical protein